MTITNDFHCTSIEIRAKVGQIVSPSTLRRVRRALCGIPTCTCGRSDGSRNSRYGLEANGPISTDGQEQAIAVDRNA